MSRKAPTPLDPRQVKPPPPPPPPEPRPAAVDLFEQAVEREIQLHHNAQRYRCECGKVLELEPKTQRTIGRRREWTCGCGTIYWKRKVNFRGEG